MQSPAGFYFELLMGAGNDNENHPGAP